MYGYSQINGKDTEPGKSPISADIGNSFVLIIFPPLKYTISNIFQLTNFKIFLINTS